MFSLISLTLVQYYTPMHFRVYYPLIKVGEIAECEIQSTVPRPFRSSVGSNQLSFDF